jgi:hypothetical protein
MDLDRIKIELPEISAKAYAKLNDLPTNYINAQCRAGILPARKLTRNGICIHNDDRGFWFVNLVALKETMERNLG